MLTYAKWIVTAAIALAVAGLLHWSLPSRTVVRILGTEVARVTEDVENAQGQAAIRTRDVRYIKAVSPDGDALVFRNEDTGWWPPYLKFDSANLAAVADDSASTEAAPTWHVVTHYGWRLTWFSTFPNAVSIKPASGPDQSSIPWFNIAVVVLIIAGVLLIRRRLMRLFGVTT